MAGSNRKHPPVALARLVEVAALAIRVAKTGKMSFDRLVFLIPTMMNSEISPSQAACRTPPMTPELKLCSPSIT